MSTITRAKASQILDQISAMAEQVTAEQRRAALYNIERMMPSMGKGPGAVEILSHIERRNEKDVQIMQDVTADQLRAFVSMKREYLNSLPE